MRIVAIAEVSDALTGTRPCRPAWSRRDALAILADETRKGWRDPERVETFVTVLGPGDAELTVAAPPG